MLQFGYNKFQEGFYGRRENSPFLQGPAPAPERQPDLLRHVATKVAVQLQLTDPELKSRDRVVKKSEKDSLYAAMDVATVWLDRALAQ